MALFGFRKKKNEETTKEQIEHKALNKRCCDRYWVSDMFTSVGEASDVAKDSIAVPIKENPYRYGDSLEIEICQKRYKVDVIRVASNKVAFKLDTPLDEEIVKEHLKKIKEDEFKTDGALELENVVHDEDIETNKAIIHLMLELDDPNTNIEKFKSNIEALPKLKDEIMKRANAIEKARAGRVEDVGTAISRLGFSDVKKIVYDFINDEVNLSSQSLPQFENFEAYHLFLTGFFKKIAPLFGFKDIKNEGQSLLNMLIINAEIISKQNPKLASMYISPKELFALEMRLLERKNVGMDFIETGKQYFVQTLEVFKYIYDGFVLGYLMLYPQYPLTFSVTLSERKLRFAYLCYLSILALKHLFSSDKYSGYLLYNRLSRMGLDMLETKKFIDELIEQTNTQLHSIGVTKPIRHKEIPSSQYLLSSIMGSGIYVDYVSKSFSLFDKKVDRLSLRYEDEMYSHDILEKILNMEEYSLKQLPFCVIPCDKLEDDDLYLDQFKAFDILVFKNIDKLPEHLFKDFQKIWNDFEGKCIATYQASSMLDFEDTKLYNLLQPFVVDFPSYYQSPTIYVKMLSYTTQKINRFFKTSLCDLSEFKEDVISQKSVYFRCLEKL